MAVTAEETESQTISSNKFESRLQLTVEGLNPYFQRLLLEISKQNSTYIIDFVINELKRENNASVNYVRINIYAIAELVKHSKKSDLKKFIKEDILSYLDSLKKTEIQDPMHKWIGTHSLHRITIIKFFKWLYYPSIESKKRPKPKIVENLPNYKRKEISIYKPTDLWSTEDDLLFLKYCPSKRDRCYHTISRDLSCRPHEILNLRLKDVVFKITSNAKQYAEVLVNGKTGSRHIPLISSIPYIKDWLEAHPQRGYSNAYLIPNLSDRGQLRMLSPSGLRQTYKNYKTKLFPSLLREDIPEDDKHHIKELLNKPWNPYIRRHSALTEKSKYLKENVLRQHSGWSQSSQMHLKYVHYFGNESSESILEAYGIVPKGKQQTNVLNPKQCPNCNEPNKPDSKFCAKCRMVLTYDAYNETIEEKQGKDNQNEVTNRRIDKFEGMIQYFIDSGQLKPKTERPYNVM
jgi:integrase/recombinase XerD